MADDEISQAQWQITKSLLVVVKEQQEVLAGLNEGYARLVRALAAQYEVELPLPKTPEDLDAMNRDIAELERMFNGNVGDKEEKKEPQT